MWVKLIEILSQPELFLAAADQIGSENPDLVEQTQESVRRLRNRLTKLETGDSTAYSGYARG